MNILHFAFTGSPDFEVPAPFYKSPSQASVNKLWEIESPQQSSESNLAKALSSSATTLSNRSSEETEMKAELTDIDNEVSPSHILAQYCNLSDVQTSTV